MLIVTLNVYLFKKRLLYAIYFFNNTLNVPDYLKRYQYYLQNRKNSGHLYRQKTQIMFVNAQFFNTIKCMVTNSKQKNN